MSLAKIMAITVLLIIAANAFLFAFMRRGINAAKHAANEDQRLGLNRPSESGPPTA
jgi:hypothetical protein